MFYIYMVYTNTNTLNQQSPQFRKTQRAIRPTEAKAIGQCDLNRALLGLIRGVITVESVGETLQVDRRRHGILSPVSTAPLRLQ